MEQKPNPTPVTPIPQAILGTQATLGTQAACLEVYSIFSHNKATKQGDFVTQIFRGERYTTIRGKVENSTYVLTELTAILEALRAMPAGAQAKIFVQNKTVRTALVQEHIQEWEQNGWRTRHRRPIAHWRTWQKICRETRLRQIQYLEDQ